MTNEVVLAKSEQYLKAAIATLERQINLGLNTPKNFDAKGALGYTALKIMDSGYKVSREVIVDTMIRVAQKGLDPRKDQLYVLPNKKGQVMLMESYFGYEKLGYDIPNVKRGSIWGDVVHKGESIKFVDRTLEHTKSLENLDNEIIGAYAKITIDEVEIALYMTAKQISGSWAQTNSLDRNFIEEKRKGTYGDYTVKTADKTKIERGKLVAFNSNQADFPEAMAKRTVIKALLGPIIKSYSDVSVAAAINNQGEGETIKEAEVINDDWGLEVVEEPKKESEVEKEKTPEVRELNFEEVFPEGGTV